MWLWLSWKSRQCDYVRTTSIVVNLVFSGVLRGAGGRHVKSFINLVNFDAACQNFAPKLDTYRFNT